MKLEGENLKLVRDAVIEGKKAIGELVAGIEQHHATALCDSMALFSLADRSYKKMDGLRVAEALLSVRSADDAARRYPDETKAPGARRRRERGKSAGGGTSRHGGPVPGQEAGASPPSHDCMENATPYQSDGALGHGFECRVCGVFLQAG